MRCRGTTTEVPLINLPYKYFCYWSDLPPCRITSAFVTQYPCVSFVDLLYPLIPGEVSCPSKPFLEPFILKPSNFYFSSWKIWQGERTSVHTWKDNMGVEPPSDAKIEFFDLSSIERKERFGRRGMRRSLPPRRVSGWWLEPSIGTIYNKWGNYRLRL